MKINIISKNYEENPNEKVLGNSVRAILATFATAGIYYRTKKIDELVLKGVKALDFTRFVPHGIQEGREDEGSENF